VGIIDENGSIHPDYLGDTVIPDDGGLSHLQFIHCTLFSFFNLDQAEFRAASAKAADDELIEAGGMRRKSDHGLFRPFGELNHLQSLSRFVNTCGTPHKVYKKNRFQASSIPAFLIPVDNLQ